MTTEVSDVAAALKTILSVLPDIDESSLNSYEPVIKTQKIALLIVPFEQRGSVAYGGIGQYSFVHEHRIVCEFWIKVDTGNVPAAMQRGRDICLQASRLLAANPTLNGTVLKLGASNIRGSVGGGLTLAEYDVLPRYEDRGSLPYIIARLFVPVEIHEIAAWAA